MEKHYYILGILLIVFGCFGGFVLEVLTFFLPILGIVLVLISDKKLWVKLVTVIFLPPIAFYLLLILVFL